MQNANFKWFAAAAAAGASLAVAVPAVHAWNEARTRVRLRALLADRSAHFEGLDLQLDPARPGDREEQEDDATLRRLANRAMAGDPTPQTLARWRAVAVAERARWSSLFPSAVSPRAAFQGESWVNLGPTDATFEWNGSNFYEVDSGRLSGVAVDPRDANVVYAATSGGGIWKTWDFQTAAPNPDWRPITDGISNLAIGAFAIDPGNPDTLYFGTGDAYDGGDCAIYKSTDGGGTWTAGLALAGSYPASAGGTAVAATSVRDLKVDPMNGSHVLVATDVGLFFSKDGGASFALVDLPNAGSTQVPEAAWSIAYLGGDAITGHWAVAGVYACGPDWLPPTAGAGVLPGAQSYMKNPAEACPIGNPGDIWVGTASDSGVTLASARAASALPGSDSGRITVAAGDPSNPGATVVYAYIGSEDESKGGATNGFWRSMDGGATWQDATGALANPTLSNDCADQDLGHAQSWYNQALAVDPTNPAHVVAGGNLCGIRTLNGTAAQPAWENVAHWLPSGGSGTTANGTLPYVHADWHVAAVVPVSGGVLAFAGSDGGIFSSPDLFTQATPENVTWNFHNRGIVTHLCYGLGSGDPADGNGFVVFTGLQDNGTRFRNSPQKPTVFDEVMGGDGTGTAVGTGTGGTRYWASLPSQAAYCEPGVATNCGSGGDWTTNTPVPGGTDAMPFVVRFSHVDTDPTGLAFLTYSNHAVFKHSGAANTPWQRLMPAMTAYARGIRASATIPQLYGIPLSGGMFAVTTNETTWITTPTQLGVGTAKSQVMRWTASIDFPPVTPSGKSPGQVFIVSSVAPQMDDESPVPDAIGHVFLTTDGGSTWTPIHGDGSGPVLPNIPVWVVRYDPGDASGNTIYAGTELGMYRTTDGAKTWQRYGYGLPLARVNDLFLSKNQSLLRISTYGRGLWEIYPQSPNRGVDGNGDFDADSGIDFVDLAALASRLGTTPASTGWPGYLWIDDLTAGSTSPPQSQIDESDLSALLAHFGDHP